MDASLRVQIRLDTSTLDLIWSIAKAKSDWFRKNNWTSSLSRFLKFGLKPTEAEHFQQFIGLCGEAAVWQWLWGDLGEFWEQQAWLHESKALSDGGEDLPGLDVKTRDLMYHQFCHQPDLLLTQNRLNPSVHYVLAIVLLHQPVVPLELDVVIAGAISGQTVVEHQQEWFSDQLQKIVISQEYLTPPQTLRWTEHQINRGK